MRKGLIITTNEQKSTGSVEPQKLNIITSAIIPEATPQPEPKGTGFEKMITTHDLEDKVEMKIGEPIDTEVRILPPFLAKIVEDHIVVESEPKKKAGRPKKAE